MPHWLVVTLLGFVEGLTEFIPVSSTGHLLIAEHWLPRQSDLFNIVVQSGAVLAVLPLFKDRLAMLSRIHEWESRSMLAKIVFAFLITAVGGVILEKKQFKLPEELVPVALALLIGGILFIVVEQWLRTRQPVSEITWLAAGVVGAAQLIAAVFPGASRSGSTIIFALILGISRVAATEFSFLVGIPTLLAAGALKTFKALHHPAPDAPHEDWAALGLASVVAAVVSFIAVKWLLRYVQTHTFVGFGIYRIALGVILLIVVYTTGAS
jgi:undecaprenyl-diphosphatase